MLGEKVGTFTGTTTDKAMPAQGGLPSFETSAQTSGKLAGAECQSMATYSAQMQPDRSLYGECPNSGVVMTSNDNIPILSNLIHLLMIRILLFQTPHSSF